MTDNRELCPFCGSEGLLLSPLSSDGDGYIWGRRIVCPRCGCGGPIAYTHDFPDLSRQVRVAHDRWNERVVSISRDLSSDDVDSDLLFYIKKLGSAIGNINYLCDRLEALGELGKTEGTIRKWANKLCELPSYKKHCGGSVSPADTEEEKT